MKEFPGRNFKGSTGYFGFPDGPSGLRGKIVTRKGFPDNPTRQVNRSVLNNHMPEELFRRIEEDLHNNPRIVNIQIGLEEVKDIVDSDEVWGACFLKWEDSGKKAGVRIRGSDTGAVRVDLMAEGKWMPLGDYIYQNPNLKEAWSAYSASLGRQGYNATLEETVRFAVDQQAGRNVEGFQRLVRWVNSFLFKRG